MTSTPSTSTPFKTRRAMSPGESEERAESEFEARRFLSALGLDLPEEPDLELSFLEPYGVATVLS
jgi:hypothetical protein